MVIFSSHRMADGGKDGLKDERNRQQSEGWGRTGCIRLSNILKWPQQKDSKQILRACTIWTILNQSLTCLSISKLGHCWNLLSLGVQVYLKAFGSIAVISLMLVLMVFAAVSQIMATLWLAAWTSGKEASANQERSVLIYFFISVSTSLANCFQAILLTLCALSASRTIHTEMLQKILAAPMSFFDSSPTGRVLNRFLQDLQNIDSFVPNAISDQIMRTLNIVTQLSLIYIEAPWVLCTLPVLAVPYSMIYRRMRIPNRDSRRLESAARSPVYAHFNDTLHGRETVRAFGAEANEQCGERERERGDLRKKTSL